MKLRYVRFGSLADKLPPACAGNLLDMHVLKIFFYDVILLC